MGRAADDCGPLIHSLRSSFATIANADPRTSSSANSESSSDWLSPKNIGRFVVLRMAMVMFFAARLMVRNQT